LDKTTLYAIGQALAHHVGQSRRPHIVIGQDTRESSPSIADTLTAGLESAGATVDSAGVVTTPAIAFLARTQDFSAGVVISASHNPWQDNGIKIFGHDGFKLPDSVELQIEKEIFSRLQTPAPATVSPRQPSLPGNHALAQTYEQWLAGFMNGVDLSGLNLVVDCANGAASAVAPEFFKLIGANAQVIHFSPNGRNINEGCGALHPDEVARWVVEQKADLGVCFDGDADRALFADHTGKVVNGDGILLLLARNLKDRKALKNNLVVATTMSNMGLEAAFQRDGISMLRAPVGDKYVLDQMRSSGAVLGGEQSGHIILSDLATTGDGLLTALQVLIAVARSKSSLAALTADLKVFPQKIRNVRVREKKPIEDVPSVAAIVHQAEAALGGRGRVIVRYSGTESLCRVMIEAEDQAQMSEWLEAISSVIQRELGS